MFKNKVFVVLALLAIGASLPSSISAQPQNIGISLPNVSPRAETTQVVGLTEIDVSYHRPAVNDREIWGALVAYDQVWRAGANENTLISFSSDVTIEGKHLTAGTYGLHMIPGESEWQVILSKDTTAWGSFSYKEKADALRVSVKPQEDEFEERLSYSFEDLANESTTLNLRWEKLRIPVKIEVDTEAVSIASIRNQLKGLSQFFWTGWNQGATYCLKNDINLEEALQWADKSIQAEERFENLSTKAQILEKTGDTDQSTEIMARALEIGNAGQLHQYGRNLLGQGDSEEAMEIFQRNAQQNPEAWFIGFGLARGYSALGEFSKAAENMKASLDSAPDGQKAYVQGMIDKLEKNEDIN